MPKYKDRSDWERQRDCLKKQAKYARKLRRRAARIQRTKDKLLQMKQGVPIVWSGSNRLRDEWELAGGNLEDCPFGEDYEGPSLCWRDGKPMIVASEFRRLSEWE